MSANIKKFNPETKQWEIIASGNSSGIRSTNPRFLNGETNVSIDECLNKLDERINLLQSNIAWLAQYGGGGSGGGSGTQDAEIVLTNANIKPNEGLNVMYSSQKRVVLEYIINALKSNQKYLISVSLDGNIVINNQEGWSGTAGNLVIEDITKYSQTNTHSIVVTASDSEGMQATPYMLTIIESSISITSSVTSVVATIGLDYKISYHITNKVLGMPTTLIVTNITNGISKSYDLGEFSSTEPFIYDVDFFSLFTGNPNTGTSYTIEAYAQTSIDQQIIESDKVTNRVVVEDGESLVVLVEGISFATDEESTEFTSGGNISFTFTPYLAGINIIYYAVQLKHGNIIKEIGIFNPTGDQKFSDNQYTQRGVSKIISYPVSTEEMYLGDWEIILRCWSEKGSPMVDTNLKCTVVQATNSILTDQNPQNSRYAWWNIKSDTFPQITTATKWISTEYNYIPPGSLDPQQVSTNLNIYNTNGQLSGCLLENGQSILRLAGESYGIIDITPFSSSVDDPNGQNWSNIGFSFSVAFKTQLHPFSDRTVFFIGDFASDGSFSEGIKITLEDIIWSYTDGNIKESITCKMQQNVLNIVDFVVDKNNDEVKIFVNGILNAAKEIKSNFTWKTNSKIYLACEYKNGFVSNFADVDFYDIKLFRRALNDKHIVINTMNTKAKSNLLTDGTIDYSLYNTWKSKNFFSVSENTTTTLLWDDQNNTYANINFNTLISDSNRKPPLPVVYIDCNGSGFTKNVYEAIGANPTIYSGCTFNYFDPNSSKSSTISTGEMSIQIQGTSSTGYRSKNLEIAFNKQLQNDSGESIGPELFQPIDTWMPENQFTLKADVVDSAHANNASIGKWINDNSDLLFDKTPPMEELEKHRPYDTRDPQTTHQKVTIKHTLEGFPVILLIKFDKTDVQEMLGIYSFNLGRNAYYNMGFKFFKSFSLKIKDGSGSIQDNQCPAFVTTYETYKSTELFGSIDQRKIYSYEFSENANLIETPEGKQPTALFWQDDLSILRHVGEFRYNGSTQDATAVSNNEVWQRLQLLFTTLASMTGEDVKKYIWDDATRSYKLGSGSYPAQQSWSQLADDLNNRLSIRNAYSYFIICIAFGLVDSLGKNMTLRSWNVGGELTDPNSNKWYPCFYDMDTANGLSNTGEENVPKTAYIDTFSNADSSSGVNSLVITQNSPNGAYDTYSSRLWDVLRDTRFTNTGVYSGLDYNGLWDSWRNNDTLIKNYQYFIDNYFGVQTEDCGELLYDYDYKVKYLTKYSNAEGAEASYANIEFLHGTRKNFVKDWLQKRFIFMDGVFMYNNPSNLYPYNEKGAFKCAGSESSTQQLLVKSNAPLIFTVNIGQTSSGDTRYFLPEGTETVIRLAPISSFNTQITINGMSQLNSINGLKDMRFQGFMTSLVLPSFAELDLSGINTLSSMPVIFETVFVNKKGYSDVRHIDLSNTSFWEANQGISVFTVNLEKFTKLKSLNISNSCVTSLSLPNAALSELNITNSQIEKLTLSSQPFIDEIDFTGCGKLKSITINNCSELTTLDLSKLSNLEEISIIGCNKLTSINAKSNYKLTNFSVSSCPELVSVDLSNSNNNNLHIYILGADKLQTLNLNGTTTTLPVELPDNLTTLKSLDLANSSINSFQYGANSIPTYQDLPILDLSNFILDSLSIQNSKVYNIKFNNSKSKPINVGTSFFRNCTNLRRIFGHINLTGYNVFYNCNNFYIHKLPEDDITPIPDDNLWYGADCDIPSGLEEWKNNTNLDSNISISYKSLSQTFYKTNVNLYDVYYILTKCDNVTSLESTFTYCTNIKTTVHNSFDRNMFKHCGKVTSTYYLFYGCTNIKTILRSPSRSSSTITADDGLMSPLKNLTNMNLMFYSTFYYCDSYLLSVKDNAWTRKYTSLSYFYPEPIKDSNKTYEIDAVIPDEDRDYLDIGILLSNLPLITSISYSFYTRNLFNTNTYNNEDTNFNYCNIFYNNTKLTSIYYSFRGTSSKGDLSYLFGGHPVFANDKQHFPQALSTIRNSFNLSSNVKMYINNSFFIKAKNTLTYITGEDTTDVYSGVSFDGINKIYLKESVDEEFCYDIFRECTKLKHCTGFFRGLQASSSININIPGDMFIDCTNLTLVDHLFSNMSSNIKYTLTSKGFKNCKLVSASNIFLETEDGYNKEGQIPYGLFYMYSTTNKSGKGWSHEDAQSLGISEKFGIDENGDWIDDDSLPSSLPETKSYNWVVEQIKHTIENLNSAFSYSRGTKINYYSTNLGDLTSSNYGDILISNENYNPIEFIINPKYDPRETIPNPDLEGETIPNPNLDIRRVIKNTDYDNYELIWNTYCSDGTKTFRNTIEASQLYTDIQSGIFTKVSKTIPSNMFDDNDKFNCSNPENYPTNTALQNYFAPADLLLYCKDSRTTDINYLFNGSGREPDTGFDYTQYGIRGRIPPRFFDPIKSITSLNFIWQECKLICPYTWTDSSGNLGNLVSSTLFSNLKNLTSLTGTFTYIIVPDRVGLNSTTFASNIQLTNIDRLFMACNWMNRTQKQVPDDLFTKNINLENIRACFASFTITVNGNTITPSEHNSGQSPKIISSTLFNSTNHKQLNNISYLFYNATETSGSVPEFWTWKGTLSNTNKAKCFNGMSKSKISNSSSIPETWSEGMVK